MRWSKVSSPLHQRKTFGGEEMAAEGMAIVPFLSKFLDSGVKIRVVDLPQIEGATGRFTLQQLAHRV